MPISTNTAGPGKLTLGAAGTLKTLTAQVRSCALVPSVDKGDSIVTLSGESVGGARTETFVLSGTLLQDLGATTSISEWLYANAGTTQPFVFAPSTAAGKQFSGSVVIESLTFGGDVGDVLESDFEWAVVGNRPALGAIS